MALLLSLRKYPTSIRYSKTSANCHRLAERLSSSVSRERELFSQAGKNDVTLVLLDRRDDVITVGLFSSFKYFLKFKIKATVMPMDV